MKSISRALGFLVMAVAVIVVVRADGQVPAGDKVVRIGYQKSGAFLLVKAQGGLEKRLAPLGYTVEWKEFPSGPPLLEALGAGALDIGHSGDAPVIFAQAAGQPIVYVADSNASPGSVGIVVQNGSSIKSVADLKGKKVALAKGSSAHYFLVKALQKAGLAYQDIQPVFLNPPDARAAFDQGGIDAWAVWDPYLASAEIKDGARLITDGTGVTPFREFYLATSDFALKHPEILREVLAELEHTGESAKKDPKAVAAFLAGQLKIDLPTLEKSELRKYRYGAQPLSPGVIAEQQAIADLFLQLGLIPKPVNVSEIVWKDGNTAPAK